MNCHEYKNYPAKKFLRISSNLPKRLFEICADKNYKLEFGTFDKIETNLHLFLIFKVEKIFLKNFQSIICSQIACEDADMN